MLINLFRSSVRNAKRWRFQSVLARSQAQVSTIAATKGDCHALLKFSDLFKNKFSLILENEKFPSMEFEGNWPDDVKQKFLRDMTVIDNFVSPNEEAELLKEIERT